MKYKLTKEQTEIYNWLKKQEINTDDDTLNYWTRKYSGMRIVEVVNFAKARIQSGQNIENLGGWVHKFLKSGLAVVNDECMSNRQFAKQFMEINAWKELKIFEKYVKDEITGDDLPLTMENQMFKTNLEKLFEKSQLYKSK
jgi:hypothetical protein